MKEQQNVAKVQEMYQAFGRGDVGHIVAQLADNVRWVSYLDPAVPWSGDYSGKSRVPAFFEAIFQSVETEAFEFGTDVDFEDGFDHSAIFAAANHFRCRFRTCKQAESIDHNRLSGACFAG